MPTVKTLSPAKVNLVFDIKGLMPDGYHRVETVLQAIDLADELQLDVEKSDTTTVRIETTEPIKSFPLDDSNLIAKAAKLFAKRLGSHFSLRVVIEKKIPIGAGLAGGSSNCAATLIGLNAAFGNRFLPAELEGMGRELGTDVPFFIQGGTQIGTGRGDILERTADDTTLFFCVLKPIDQSVSTPWAYKEFDNYKGRLPKLDIQQTIAALGGGELDKAIHSFGNSFEPCIFEHIPALATLKSKMLELGCWSCHLSGSGPSLFAVVADREQAHAVRRKFLKVDDDGFNYYSNFKLSPDFGPPVEFHIAESIKHGAKVLDAVQSH